MVTWADEKGTDLFSFSTPDEREDKGSPQKGLRNYKEKKRAKGSKLHYSLDNLAQIPANTNTIRQHGKGVTDTFVFYYLFHFSSRITE